MLIVGSIYTSLTAQRWFCQTELIKAASYLYQLTQRASDPSKGTSLKHDKSEIHTARFCVAALLSQRAAAAAAAGTQRFLTIRSSSGCLLRF